MGICKSTHAVKIIDKSDFTNLNDFHKNQMDGVGSRFERLNQNGNWLKGSVDPNALVDDEIESDSNEEEADDDEDEEGNEVLVEEEDEEDEDEDDSEQEGTELNDEAKLQKLIF